MSGIPAFDRLEDGSFDIPEATLDQLQLCDEMATVLARSAIDNAPTLQQLWGGKDKERPFMAAAMTHSSAVIYAAHIQASAIDRNTLALTRLIDAMASR